MTDRLRIGLIVNPWAGIGGAVALRGSDGSELRDEALRRGAKPQAAKRCTNFFTELGNRVHDIDWYTVTGAMGAEIAEAVGVKYSVVSKPGATSTADDTRDAVTALEKAGADLIVFVGGDGTARDVMTASRGVPVLGVPAGVKMHSGVFAVTPRTAALIVLRLLDGELVASVAREVRDFVPPQQGEDEMRIQHFGVLPVPEVGGYLQQTKVGGRESEPLALEEICAGVTEIVEPHRSLIVGPGSTCAAIKSALGLTVTLRGFDARRAPDGALLEDARANELHTLTQPLLVVSFTRAQGFLFGRGNQQLDADLLGSLAWPDDVLIVGTRTKLASLEGRPLLVDTGESKLNARFAGLVEILTGYEDTLFYRVATEGE